ncbi:Uncharacterized protein ACO02O_07060 [Dirofilaria immitis]
MFHASLDSTIRQSLSALLDEDRIGTEKLIIVFPKIKLFPPLNNTKIRFQSFLDNYLQNLLNYCTLALDSLLKMPSDVISSMDMYLLAHNFVCMTYVLSFSGPIIYKFV